ncbi:MAG: 6,7-dimethyl-8-ribityllumazine synthase [Gemmatimonadales bacterium]|nr:MAG: 6,7-dimethyl-8-ribityllumazine synthase [Gemmatimonadales bacterium]
MNVIEGSLDGTGRRVTLVVARFNERITESLLEAALDCLRRHGVADDDLEVVRVPGAWELGGAAGRVADRGGTDAIIGLGCVIRGATPHFEYVAGEAARGLATVGHDAGIPVIFGVLTTDTLEQAFERAGTKAGNKGWEAAMSALEMMAVYREIG